MAGVPARMGPDRSQSVSSPGPMAKIAYLLLTHKDPEGVILQARQLAAAGDVVAIHYDANAALADYEQIRDALGDNPSVVLAKKRVKCGWGEWSLVEATLQALRAAVGAFPQATHFYMLSGDCMPIKSAEYVHDFLMREDVDYIESFDFHNSGWIKTGIREERLIYRHWFNERRRKKLFYASLHIQKRLGLKRKVPADLEMQIGSQWWCLRRQTVEAVLDFIDRRPDVMRFFRTTWIPDETFFQTLVRHLIPGAELRSRTLTFLMFTDYGMPVTFYNDHYDLLLTQNYLFARKISPEAKELKTRLRALYGEKGQSFVISGEGRRLYRFLSERGRVGHRFAPRFWEAEKMMIGRDRELLIVVCKKWHVAKRLVHRLQDLTGIATLDYLFNEHDTKLPDLGGIQATIEKRTRHRRVLMRMLYDLWQTDRLAFCIDPSDFDLIADFYADKARVRLLEIECDFSDDYLAGHAQRVGLTGAHPSAETLARLLPTIRYDLRSEAERIRESGLPGYYRIRERASPRENAQQLAAFAGITRGRALEITATSYLFVDG